MADPASILDVWERGLHLPAQRTIVALLAAVMPETTPDAIAALPLGRRDALLLDLRERLFGPDLATVATCPACSEPLEAGFATTDVRAAPPDQAAGEQRVTAGAQSLRYRLPATADLIAIPPGATPDAARAVLLERCVADEHGAVATLTPDAAHAVAADMARADPQALVELALACPACGHGFAAAFDIGGFLLREIDAWARQMLRDIHALARAYGWREGDVLALTPLRRRLYLDMVAQ